jgi:hypothetical protein
MARGLRPGNSPGRRIGLTPLPPDQVDPDCPGRFHAAHRAAYTHHGCRCPAAKQAYSRDHKLWRNGLRSVGPPIPAHGTRRRLQGLAVMGHTLVSIAAKAGVSVDTLTRVRAGTAKMVTPTVADAVRRVYDLWWDTDGGSAIAKHQAAEHQWPPPMWWDDDRIDDPRAQGPKRRTSKEERRAG